MRSFTFISYMLISLGVFGMALWHYRTQVNQDSLSASKKGTVFYPFSYRDIQSVELISKEKSSQGGGDKTDAKKIFLQKKTPTSSWNMEHPFNDLLDEESIKQWLGEMLSKEVKILKTGKNIKWETYGLDKKEEDLHSFTLSSFDGKKKKLLVSNYSAFDGSFYMQLRNLNTRAKEEGEKKESSSAPPATNGDDPILLLGSLDWAHLKNTKPESFRELKVFSFKSDEEHDGLKSLSLSHLAETTPIVFTRSKKGVWAYSKEVLESPPPLLAQKINEWWTNLGNLKFKEEPVYKKNQELLKKYKLLEQDLMASLTYERDKNHVLNISKKSKSDNYHYATITGRDFIFTLDPFEVEKVTKKIGEFTDKGFPFQQVSYDDEVFSLEWNQREMGEKTKWPQSFRLEKTEHGWKKALLNEEEEEEKAEELGPETKEVISEEVSDKKEEAGEEGEKKEDRVESKKTESKGKNHDQLMEEHFLKLKNLRVKKYFLKPPSSFISKSHYILKGKEGEPIFRLDFGKKRSNSPEDGENQSIVVKAKNVESFFSLDEEDFKQWINTISEIK